MIIEDFVSPIMEFHGNKDDIAAIVQAGSSLNRDLADCLDIDFVILSSNTLDEGSFTFTVDGFRVEAAVVPLPRALEVVKAQVRSQTVTLCNMILGGKLVYGDASILASLQVAVRQVLEMSRPFFMPQMTAFALTTFLYALKRTSRASDAISYAMSILELLAKSDGPSRGEWPLALKHFLRRAEQNEGLGEGSLVHALSQAALSSVAPMVAYVENWMKENNMQEVNNFKMLKPRQLIQPALQPA